MSRTILTTFSDDRARRKGGLYEATQKKVHNIFCSNTFYGSEIFDSQSHWNIRDLQESESIIWSYKPFWEENKTMLESIDPAINGRLYKPYIISCELSAMKDGDFLIYNDVSPEMWKMDKDFKIDESIYDLNVIKGLCNASNDFLVAFVKWAPENFIEQPLGIHTHHYFTLEPCIKAMDAEKYRHSFQCASGMICIKKTIETVKLVNEWLEWNKNWLCASIGNPAIPGDESLWDNREDYKLGCRHDQSILSILLNKRNWDFVDIVYNDISPYNFLNFCRTDHDYKFINSNIK